MSCMLPFYITLKRFFFVQSPSNNPVVPPPPTNDAFCSPSNAINIPNMTNTSDSSCSLDDSSILDVYSEPGGRLLKYKKQTSIYSSIYSSI